jgi:hypothetical protein
MLRRSNRASVKRLFVRIFTVGFDRAQRMPSMNTARMGDVGKAVGFPRLTALLFRPSKANALAQKRLESSKLQKWHVVIESAVSLGTNFKFHL